MNDYLAKATQAADKAEIAAATALLAATETKILAEANEAKSAILVAALKASKAAKVAKYEARVCYLAALSYEDVSGPDIAATQVEDRACNASREAQDARDTAVGVVLDLYSSL